MSKYDYGYGNPLHDVVGKLCAWLGLALVLFAIGWSVKAEIMAEYQYDREIGSYWELSVKASSLETKAMYLNEFVAALEYSGIQEVGYNALYLKTPDNSVANNLLTLHSLQNRMNEIKGMDVQSFAYQQAIQQITAQEQGEATHMLAELQGAWYLKNHFYLWNWVDVIRWSVLIVALSVSVIALIAIYDSF